MENKTLSFVAIGIAVIAVVIAIIATGHSAPVQVIKSGGVTNYDTIAGNGLKIGSGCNDSNATCAGTTFTAIQGGTCNLTQYTLGSFPASTTAQFFCTVSNVVAGDRVFVTLPIGAGTNLNGSGSVGLGFQIVGAYATSSGQIGVTIANFTGAATTTFPQATTSVQYLVTR